MPRCQQSWWALVSSPPVHPEARGQVHAGWFSRVLGRQWVSARAPAAGWWNSGELLGCIKCQWDNSRSMLRHQGGVLLMEKHGQRSRHRRECFRSARRRTSQD
ncbi:hypothetical protein BD309DRAFT_956539 [Dichomitus squalens]|uniref:Uncharacterized protein n=1 Tax=Dichomitus squalens TaxID=114155 RepID=A0A4Q9NU51_9APHY|nr:hypothetical protein BD309DRAFT_956539 [Dichomitus squalens]TBU61437.1 hypothetical protein BD310DRAFT_920768 [Dichomitus squalens]